jgi:membrane protein DedA with SNARE-associated domain
MRTLPPALAWTLLALLTCAAILVPFVLWEEPLLAWSRFLLGLRGARSLVALTLVVLLSADLFLPVPSSFVSAGAISLLGPLLGAFVIWLGMSIGAVIGFWLGRSGGVALAQRVVGERELGRAERLMQRFGGWVVVFCRGVPVLAEASTLLAGTARMPFAWFSLLSLTANAGIAAAYAWLSCLGSNQTVALLVPFALGILVPALAIAIVKGVERKSRS